MDEFKKKVSNFIHMKRPSIANEHVASIEEELYSMTANEIAIIKSKEESRNLPLNNPHREREVLENIDAAYFCEQQSFDISEFELKKLPTAPDLNQINTDRKLMREQLSVVTKKISDFILENYPSYSAELRKVTELQLSIKNAFSICQNGRRRLSEAESVLTVAGLNILTKYRKKQRMLKTFEALSRIKTLQETDMKLRELLEEENMVSAIQLCLECRKAAEMYKEYACISDLTSKLKETLVEIESHLDRVLAANTLRLDLERYSRVMAAYEILNKTEYAAERIIIHFRTALSNTSFSVVKEHSTFDHSPSKELSFADLCKRIPSDRFSSCFQELLKLTWQILFSYHCFIWWHKEHSLVACSTSRNVVREKLESNLAELYRYASKSLNELVQSVDLTFLKFDDFLRVVDFAHRFVEIGAKHFGSELDSDGLHETLRQQSLNYFKSHHRACLEELRMFLETEEWKCLPVRHHFGYKDLPEFSFMTKLFDKKWTNGVNQTVAADRGEVGHSSTTTANWKLMDPTYVNPFDSPDADFGENVKDNDGACDDESDDSDVADELKKDFVEETLADGRQLHSSNGVANFKRHHSYKSVDKLSPFVCNSSLNLLRLFGRYLHIATILTPISFDIISWLSQLFDYYFYAIYQFFGSAGVVFGVYMSNEKLDSALNRIRNNLGFVLSSQFESVSHNERRSSFCRLSTSVDLIRAESLFGLTERICGVESAIFISKQLVDLKPVIEELMPVAKKAFIQQFYAHTVNVCGELRRPVYGVVSWRSLNLELLLNSVASTNWEISELMSQHNAYVDFILQDMADFRRKLTEVCTRIHVPTECYQILWEFNIRMINRVLVEGFSYAKKCTHEGRALMQLDFQQLLLKLEKLMTLRPIPDKEFVENFIKAYYLPESSMEQWVSDRKEYSTRQVISLLNSASHISKKTRQRLISGLHQQEIDETANQ